MAGSFQDCGGTPASLRVSPSTRRSASTRSSGGGGQSGSLARTSPRTCFRCSGSSRTGALTMVILPVVSLMADLVAKLEQHNIGCCTTINGLLSMPERADATVRPLRALVADAAPEPRHPEGAAASLPPEGHRRRGDRYWRRDPPARTRTPRSSATAPPTTRACAPPCPGWTGRSCSPARRTACRSSPSSLRVGSRA